MGCGRHMANTPIMRQQCEAKCLTDIGIDLPTHQTPPLERALSRQTEKKKKMTPLGYMSQSIHTRHPSQSHVSYDLNHLPTKINVKIKNEAESKKNSCQPTCHGSHCHHKVYMQSFPSPRGQDTISTGLKSKDEGNRTHSCPTSSWAEISQRQELRTCVFHNVKDYLYSQRRHS